MTKTIDRRECEITLVLALLNRLNCITENERGMQAHTSTTGLYEHMQNIIIQIKLGHQQNVAYPIFFLFQGVCVLYYFATPFFFPIFRDSVFFSYFPRVVRCVTIFPVIIPEKPPSTSP